jgi:LysM repeat protein
VLGVGDSLASVAVRYGISLTELRKANPGFKNLKAGDTIRVPDSLSSH